jgi:hypothetical protein
VRCSCGPAGRRVTLPAAGPEDHGVHPLATRRRSQPAPPWAVVEALVRPDGDPARRWLRLQNGEVRPLVLEEGPAHVLWSSPWPDRPGLRVRLDVTARPEGADGADLRWTLLGDAPLPAEEVRALRRRLDELLNRDLRQSFDQ